MFEHFESVVVQAVLWIKLGIEIAGVFIIAWGVLVALRLFIPSLLSGDSTGFAPIRLILARYLALALEFQLGADILSTAVAPSWEAIGKLGAIAVIRTGLNYFLSLEMRHEKAEVEKIEREGGVVEEDESRE